MRLLGINIPSFFKPSGGVVETPLEEFELHEKSTDNLPLGSTAWSEDAIFQSINQRKYNPDDLIGRKGFQIYKKMLIDEQVKAVVKFKRDAVTSREFNFVVDVDKLGEEEAARRLAINDAIMSNLKGTAIDAFNAIMTAVPQGVSYVEKNFMHIEVDGKTYWGIKQLKLKPFDTFEFKVDVFGEITGFFQRVGGKDIELDINKFVHFVQNPEVDEQYGQSELREAYRSWFSKDMAITFYNMWLERSASGFKWIKTDETPGSSEYRALQNVLRNTVNGAGMLIGMEDEFNIEFPGGDGKAFGDAMDKHDLGIARALLVPNLMGITPAGQTGSFSQSDTQLEAFLWTLDQDASRLEEALNEQLFRQLGEVNFGDDLWPRIKFQPISDKQIKAIITLWKDLVTANAVTKSESDEKHIRNLLDFPEKEEGVEGGEEEEDEGDTNHLPGTDPIVEDELSIHKKSKKKKGAAMTPTDIKESLLGNLRILYSEQAKKEAIKRVDFTVIQRTTEATEEKSAEPITDIMFKMTKDTVNQVKVLDAKGDLESKSLTVKFSKKDKSKLQKLINSSLQEFWNIGQKHAENEVDKAQGLAFSMKVDRERLNFISVDFFTQKSFKVAGKLTEDAIAIIQNEINNGMKGGKTFEQIETSIYRSMGAEGFLSEADYKAALGSALDPNLVNPQARIDTMLRTNGFEAVNEARFSYFTDPQLDGFVEALEYSAIMDGRTTQICQHLDGKTYSAGAETWETHRPPNHFNCRSLLIPVTKADSWKGSEAPTIEPQKGFA